MDLYIESFDVVCAVGSAGEVGEVELDLIPAFVKAHGHCTNEGFHSSSTLIIAGSEPASDVLVIEDHDFEGEVFFHVLDDHHEEREFDA